ncbi:hypothetical protein OAG94_02510 [bacterium]|jgi:hypothetical protein|nr:hypothetical protein [bacterium]|tara:strand:- start:227 stop:400 length:174 start_codon:yes stop_codon:yes gene_type:complete
MKQKLLTTIAVVVLVGFATTQSPNSPLIDAIKKIKAVKSTWMLVLMLIRRMRTDTLF